jgi:hypothetical protein
VAQPPVSDGAPRNWVTVAEAARRLRMSRSWFRALAKHEGIEVQRRGRQPGVNWQDVEAFISRSRITEVTPTLLRDIHPEMPIPGVALAEEVKTRFGWSDHDVADALGVWPSTLSRYRLTGVPEHQIQQLQVLARLTPADVDPPRQRVPKRGQSGLPNSARRKR